MTEAVDDSQCDGIALLDQKRPDDWGCSFLRRQGSDSRSCSSDGDAADYEVCFTSDENSPLESRPLLRRTDTGTSLMTNPEMKTISFFGSTILLVNTICGPGFLVIPMVYQQSGWVLPTVLFIFMFVASSFSATFLTDAIARIPGNSDFDRRIEFACIFDHYFGPRTKRLAQTMLLLCFLSQISASIVASAQLVDSLIVALTPDSTTYALQVSPAHSLSLSLSLSLYPLSHTHSFF
jgi:hypothetical protein